MSERNPPPNFPGNQHSSTFLACVSSSSNHSRSPILSNLMMSPNYASASATAASTSSDLQRHQITQHLPMNISMERQSALEPHQHRVRGPHPWYAVAGYPFGYHHQNNNWMRPTLQSTPIARNPGIANNGYTAGTHGHGMVPNQWSHDSSAYEAHLLSTAPCVYGNRSPACLLGEQAAPSQISVNDGNCGSVHTTAGSISNSVQFNPLAAPKVVSMITSVGLIKPGISRLGPAHPLRETIGLKAPAVQYRCLFQRKCLELTGDVFETDCDEEMTQHLRKIHMEWLPVICALCSLALPTNHSLKLHFAAEHPDQGAPKMEVIEKSEGYKFKKKLCKDYLVECEVLLDTPKADSVSSFLPPEESVPSIAEQSNPSTPAQRSDAVAVKEEEAASSTSSESSAINDVQRGRVCSLCAVLKKDSGETVGLQVFPTKIEQRAHAEKHLFAEGKIDISIALLDSDPMLISMMDHCFGQMLTPEQHKELKKRKEPPDAESSSPVPLKQKKRGPKPNVKLEVGDPAVNRGDEETPPTVVESTQKERIGTRSQGQDPPADHTAELRSCFVNISAEDREMAESFSQNQMSAERGYPKTKGQIFCGTIAAAEASHVNTISQKSSISVGLWGSPVTCGTCGKSICVQYRSHALTHVDKKKFVCSDDDCLYSTNYEKLMHRHLKLAHSSMSMANVLDQQNEVKEEMELQLAICFPEFVKADPMERELALQSKDLTNAASLNEATNVCNEPPFVCPYCTVYSAEKRQSLCMHIMRKHPKQWPEWKRMAVTMEKPNSLPKQERAVSACELSDEVECRLCKLVVKKRGRIMHVRRSHMTIKEYGCTSCKFQACTQENMEFHLASSAGCFPAFGQKGFVIQKVAVAKQKIRMANRCFPSLFTSKRKNGAITTNAQSNPHVIDNRLQFKAEFDKLSGQCFPDYAKSHVGNTGASRSTGLGKISVLGHASHATSSTKKAPKPKWRPGRFRGNIKSLMPNESQILAGHARHNRGSKCLKCSKPVVSHQRSRHVWSVHVNETIFKCPFCDSVSSKSIPHPVKRHIERYHDSAEYPIDLRMKHKVSFLRKFEECFPLIADEKQDQLVKSRLSTAGDEESTKKHVKDNRMVTKQKSSASYSDLDERGIVERLYDPFEFSE